MILALSVAKKYDLDIELIRKDIQLVIKTIELNNRNLQNQIKMTNKRMDDLDKKLSQKIDSVDKKRSQRIDVVYNIMVTLLGGIFVLIGFMWWDRRTLIYKAKEEMDKSVEQKLEIITKDIHYQFDQKYTSKVTIML